MTITFSPLEISLSEENEVYKIISRETSNFNWGKNPIKRPIQELFQYGIINLDKPARPTSHEVVSFVKKILNIPKAGHSGTLDPQVTGVLPIALGKATRILDTLLLAGKEYVCLMRLHSDIEEDKIISILNEYKGEIYQRPPVRASVKRVLRIRKIYENEILEINGRDILFRVKSQAGTYLRKYCHDIGQSLGCGAHMKELRRTQSGPFTENKYLATLQDLYDAYVYFMEEKEETPLRNIILPMEYGIRHLPKIFVKDSAVDPLCHGAPLAIPGISKITPNFSIGDMVAIFTLKHELIALGQAQVKHEDVNKENKGFVANIKRVLMPIGTYPTQKKNKESN